MNASNNNYVTHQYVGPYFVPHGWTVWNNQTAYQPLAVVSYNMGWYILKKPAPVGTIPTDQEYWAPQDNITGQIGIVNEEIDKIKTDLTETSKLTNENRNGMTQLPSDYIFNYNISTVAWRGNRLIQCCCVYNNEIYFGCVEANNSNPAVIVTDFNLNLQRTINIPDWNHMSGIYVDITGIYIAPNVLVAGHAPNVNPNSLERCILHYSATGEFIGVSYASFNINSFVKAGNFIFMTSGESYNYLMCFRNMGDNLYVNEWTKNIPTKYCQSMSTDGQHLFLHFSTGDNFSLPQKIQVYNFAGQLIREYILPVEFLEVTNELQSSYIIGNTIYAVCQQSNIYSFEIKAFDNVENVQPQNIYFDQTVCKTWVPYYLNNSLQKTFSNTTDGNVITFFPLYANYNSGCGIGHCSVNGTYTLCYFMGAWMYMLINCKNSSNNAILSGTLRYGWSGGANGFILAGININKMTTSGITSITDITPLKEEISSMSIETCAFNIIQTRYELLSNIKLV